MSKNKCQAVIFDMDGVLVDSEEFIAAACCAMFAEKGQFVQPQDFRPFIGTGDDRFIGGVAEKYNVKVDLPADKERAYDIYLEMIKGKLKPLDGVTGFLEKCRSLGLKTAVASSADLRKVNGNLAEIELDHGQFDAVVCAEDVAHKKPSPDIFILAASRLQVEPNRCLVIEDAISGVSAAKAAGAMCLGITTSFSKEQLGADFHAANLAEAGDEVLKW